VERNFPHRRARGSHRHRSADVLEIGSRSFRRFPRIPSGAARFIAIAAVAVVVLWLMRAPTTSGRAIRPRRSTRARRRELGGAARNPRSAGAYLFVNAIFLTNANSVLTFFSIAREPSTPCSRFAQRPSSSKKARRPERGGSRRRAPLGRLRRALLRLRRKRPDRPRRGACVHDGIDPASPGQGHAHASRVLLAAAILSHLSAAFLVGAFAYLVARAFARPPREERRSRPARPSSSASRPRRSSISSPRRDSGSSRCSRRTCSLCSSTLAPAAVNASSSSARPRSSPCCSHRERPIEGARFPGRRGRRGVRVSRRLRAFGARGARRGIGGCRRRLRWHLLAVTGPASRSTPCGE